MDRRLQAWYESSHLSGVNAAAIESWYESWLEDPASVPEAWAREFVRLTNGAGRAEMGQLRIREKFRQLAARAPAAALDGRVADHKEASVLKLIEAYRIRGHEAARLDPLGLPHREPVPDLALGYNDLDDSDLDREFDTGTLAAEQRMKLRDIVTLCERVYCGSIGVEYMHIFDTVKRYERTRRKKAIGGARGRRSGRWRLGRGRSPR